MTFHLAQLNIARMRGVNIEDPIMASFVAQLGDINALAEDSPGFIWRLKDDDGNATHFNPFHDERIIINLSVWKTIEDLENFVFKSRHLEVMKNRRTWFENFGKAYLVLWWIPAGHTPSVEEAISRLTHLQNNGSSQYAFDFRNKF
jgi:hypothetical protein